MELAEMARLRLLHQQLTGTTFTTAAEMVTWLGAVQAQEYAQAKWALGLRLPHLVDQDVERDFAEGRLLRTHLLRPTWHFVAPQDIRWLLRLTAPRVHAANAYMYRQLELDTGLFRRCNDILTKVLRDGKQLTRAAINDEFKQNNIKAEGHRLSYLMMQAELEGLICSGARQGNQFTYALLDERVPSCPAVQDLDEALAELARRYFTSRGPATIKDFSTWSGLTVGACRRGLALVPSDLLHERIQEQDYYYAAPANPGEKYLPSMLLLPIYDEYIMGYQNRDAMLFLKNRMATPPKLRFDSTIHYDGQLVGTWRRTIKSKSVELEYDLLKPLSSQQQRSFLATIRRFESFSGLPVRQEPLLSAL